MDRLERTEIHRCRSLVLKIILENYRQYKECCFCVSQFRKMWRVNKGREIERSVDEVNYFRQTMERSVLGPLLHDTKDQLTASIMTRPGRSFLRTSQTNQTKFRDVNGYQYKLYTLYSVCQRLIRPVWQTCIIFLNFKFLNSSFRWKAVQIFKLYNKTELYYSYISYKHKCFLRIVLGYSLLETF